MRILTLALFATAIAFLSGSTLQGQIFNEDAQGDFSNIETAPTSLGNLATGISFITGTSQSGAGDRDHVTFTIGPNSQLTSLEVLEFAPNAGDGSFFGLAESNTVPASGEDFLFAGLLAIPSSGPGVEILGDASGGSFGGTSVPTVLGPGDYSILFNETGAVNANYTAQLTVTSTVPEPASAFLLGGLGLFVARRRRR